MVGFVDFVVAHCIQCHMRRVATAEDLSAVRSGRGSEGTLGMSWF